MAELERITQQSAEWERNTGKTSSTISPKDEARIRAEVRDIMQKQFATARAKLESNPVAHKEAFVKSSAATSDVDVIDLISQSVASLKKPQPTIISGSPISVVRVPLPMLGMEGAPRDSRIYRLDHTPRLPHHHLPQCTRSPKSLHAFSDAVPRMSIHGRPWCATTSPLWGSVTPSKSPTR